jgi:hypothetical protein
MGAPSGVVELLGETDGVKTSECVMLFRAN